jgi:O-antigen ligase
MEWGASVALGRSWDDFAGWTIRGLLRPLQLLVSAPSLLLIAALTAMLLRHPDVQFFSIDRVAFGLLVGGVVVRAVIVRESLFVFDRATWPMLALTILAVLSAAGQPFEHETWSLIASKFMVPFTLFHLAGVVFTDEARLRQFEVFSLVVLAYLSFTAIAFFAGIHALIFPRFILDPNVGFHAERARGPLLQAVANGVSLNILALLAVHAYQRASVGRKKVLVVLLSVPLAIVATMTRAVWLAAAGSAVAVLVRSGSPCVRRAWIWVLMFVVGGVFVLSSSQNLSDVLSERLEERGPIEYRAAVYSGGWEMFLERPWLGWGVHQMPAELPRHVSGYKERVLYPHNTYLELLVEHGIVGLGVYLWLMWELWRLRKGAIPEGDARGFLDQEFHRMWPILLCVYWLNAAVVVMSYQFVNGLLFTIAGMLAGQRRRAERMAEC